LRTLEINHHDLTVAVSDNVVVRFVVQHA
jgi:hypothetical protein